jgi:Protein of unknown function (DUF1761)
MMSKNINHLAVWLAAIVFFLWGYVWWNLLFGKQVMAMMTQSGASMAPPGPIVYLVGFLMALVLGYGTAIALADSTRPGASHGISFGIFMGVVFYASTTLTQTLFGGHPISWWLLEVGWALIGFALVGAIVGGMTKRAA